MIRYYHFEQRSPQWHSYRKGRWTGSTAIDLLKGKTAPPQSDSSYDNKYMLRGRMLEPLAVEEYERWAEVSVAHFGFITNSEYPHAGYSPDGIQGDTLLEVKCVNAEKHDALVAGEIPTPTEWIAQIQFGLLITGLQKARLVLYNPDAKSNLFIFDIEAEPKIQANMIDRLEATRPKERPSSTAAKQKYLETHKMQIKQRRRERYLRNKVL